MNIVLLTLLFVGVNLDFFVILLFLLKKYSFKAALIGYGIGMLFLWFVAATISQTLHEFIPAWSLGILGLIPIFMALKGGDDEEASETKQKSAILAVTAVYLGTCGADNMAIYVPVLSSLTIPETLLGAVYITILMILSTILAQKIDNLPIIGNAIEKYGEIATRLIYVIIGVGVILESNLVPHLIQLTH
ncbi:cadmium resistance transporter [Periweissella fabaria]|uniref:Uncharacterized protein n=1 Tax=Periweissella fabaria TaxID=546157 RepID=A0ABN8BHW7_9LACO|nr:cadmium resistance transporter [Periweissella fabaria]MCM0597275.1 cadmium resistance transporter [Periweissella fabaria]CAH0416219.1 hypothetical protein WFA24289_00518 [Periweissella fabaria]